ncbi:MAG: HAD family hydrolase [Candidatus Methanoperedens sp.]|nr:HAD family hydrolase [Candidatus Methanoperedens sp.]
MAIRLIIFDVDNTLAEPNKPIHDKIINIIKQIEASGTKIALISGKPSAYLCGFARQIGLQTPIICGENGAFINYSSNFPPEKEYINNPGKKEAELLEELKSGIINEFGKKVWMQPNRVNLTIFPKTRKIKNDLSERLAAFSTKPFFKELAIYVHSDSIEVVPSKINKGRALRKIRSLEKLKKEEIIAVGNGENDIPMFKEAGISIGIKFHDATYTFSNIKKALEYIIELIQKEKEHER